MIALIDYENLPKQARINGLIYIVDRVLQALSSVSLPLTRRLLCRMYGGWYSGGGPTRLAQTLAAEATGDFPRTLRTALGPVIADTELAYSLAAEPARHLLRTYRGKASIDGAQCKTPADAGCKNGSCPFIPMEMLFRNGVCPTTGCAIGLDALVYRKQQKLVDTMLACDLLHLADADPRLLCVVSSDDDLWPGIRMALLRGRVVIQMHTLPLHTTHAAYASGAGPNYRQVAF